MNKSKGALFVKRKPDIYRCKPTNKKSSAFSKNTNVEMEVQPKDRPKKAVTHKV